RRAGAVRRGPRHARRRAAGARRAGHGPRGRRGGVRSPLRARPRGGQSAAPARQGAAQADEAAPPRDRPPRAGARAAMTGLRVRDLLERKGDPLQLEALTGEVGLERIIPTPEASSPGLVLAGYTKRFAAHRMHVLGETEITYLASLGRSEEHTSELQSRGHLVCRLLLEKKNPT